MTDHPILYSGPMVNALLAGGKTQTRRTSKAWLKVKEGDRLWVREAWAEVGTMDPGYTVYRASYPDCLPPGLENVPETIEEAGYRWKPSIHMHRHRSRLTLIATADAREERLQDISEDDAKAEGAMFHDGRGVGHSGWRHDYTDVYDDARSSFARLWQSLYTKPGERWEDNPELVVLSFRVVRENIDQIEGQK
jgi:hypothetical protein